MKSIKNNESIKSNECVGNIKNVWDSNDSSRLCGNYNIYIEKSY